VVLWVVTPCGDIAGYQRFGGPYCRHLQSKTTRRHNPGISRLECTSPWKPQILERLGSYKRTEYSLLA